MPKSCCVAFCTNNTSKTPDKKFHIIPTDAVKRKAWLRAINRAQTTLDGKVIPGALWSPKSKWCYVCSDHFISGERSLASSHPDYVPSIFPKPTSSSSSKEKKIQSPHRQRFERHKRRLVWQGKRGVSKKLLLTSPDLTLNDDEVPSCSKEPEDVTMELYHEEPAQSLNDETNENFDNQSPITSMYDSIYLEMDNLRKEKDDLLKENVELRRLLKSTGLRYDAAVESEDNCILLTGLKPNVLICLVNYLVKDRSKLKPHRLSFEDQLVLTIVKLKHNLVFDLLAAIFGISSTTAIEYFWCWIDIMHGKLKRLVRMQDRDYIFRTIPPHFKPKFPRLTSIIDCFEVFVESPSSLLARAKFYSHYKKHTTIKVFISCTPLGAVNFVSKCYGGRAADVQVVKESDFHLSKFHMPGDQILADRGFTMVEEFAAGSCSELLIPAFTTGKKQLSAKEVETSRKIASVRIHIERVIGLIRNRYTILKGKLPLRIVKSIKDEASSSILANCDRIVVVCAALVNLGESIIYKE